MGNAFITNVRPRVRIFGTGYRFFDLDYSYVLLNKPELDKSIWDGCDLRRSLINLGNIRNALFRQCDMTFATIHNTAVIDTEFLDVKFTKATIDASTFIKCRFNGVYFDYCFLDRASFVNCRFEECSFCGVNANPGVFDISCSFEGGSPDTGKPYIPMACPDEGAFFGYKKVRVISGGAVFPGIAKLYIPDVADRSSGTGRKCRCQFARVMSITGATSETKNEEFEEAISFFDPHFHYHVGSMVYPDAWDEDRWNECSHGIHFFMNKQEALDY